MYFFRHLTARCWAIWKELRQLDLFKNWMAYPVCSFQANSVQNLSFKNRIWLYWLCVYFLSIVCTCRTLGAIKEKNIIVWYFSFFTVILFFFFYQRLTSSHSLPQDKALQIYNYETDQFITNGWVQTTCLVQRILVLNMCLLLSNEFKKKKSLNIEGAQKFHLSLKIWARYTKWFQRKSLWKIANFALRIECIAH